jgi:Protein of unknown function (DUF3300)
MRRTSVIAFAILTAIPVLAQAPPSFPRQQLDQLVSRIALYPDPLLAQVLAAATFPEQIPDAAQWADEHHYVTGDALAQDIEQDQLPWDPSVQALLPFPSVLGMMASDMNWTRDLGDAFLAQNQDVMDAVQRMRRQAQDFGYLRTNGQIIVSGGPYIQIAPLNPAVMYVPFYDPLIVFARPRPGFVVARGITFSFGISIGPVFRPWGWGGNRIVWNTHTVIVNNAPWRRSWVNRNTYAHPYTIRRAGPAPREVERHQLERRTDREKTAERSGGKRLEEHGGQKGNSKQGGKGQSSKGKGRR